MLFLHVCYSNSNPQVIGKRYLEFLHETEILPTYLRMDRGTETGKMATMHVYLINKLGTAEDPTDSVIYGPSTSNTIERWWRDFHERLEKFFKSQLSELLRGREYDPHNALDRQLLAYVYVPIIQRECDIFVEYWNAHRIREQENLELPTGVPNHMFSFPEQYGASHKGHKLRREQLRVVAETSGVSQVRHFDFMEQEVKRQCEHYLPNVNKVKSMNAIEVCQTKSSCFFGVQIKTRYLVLTYCI